VKIKKATRREWEKDERLLSYIGLLAYEYPKKEVAKKMGISLSTLKLWAKESPIISQALTKTRDKIVKELEETLNYKAKGFEYEESKTVTVKGKGGEPDSVRVEKYKKYSPPDSAAAIFLITNLSPEKWQNKQKVDTTVKGDTGKLDEIIKQLSFQDIEMSVTKTADNE